MRYLLTRSYLKPSARILARELNLRIRTELLDGVPPIIRWGNSDTGRYHPDLETEFNYPEVIRICSNKRMFSDAMVRMEIPCVEIKTGIPESYPVAVRQTLSGSKGAGIVICKSFEEFRATPNNRFWSKWYNFRYELGVHIFKGTIIKMFKKVWTDGEEEEFPIRNMDRGYHFSRVNPENFKSLIPFISDFYDKFSMSFGRLDIGFDVDSRTNRIIEANSAPGIAENDDTLHLYAEKLLQELNNAQ